MSYRGVDRLLSHFLVVAEQGGITKAANVLNITQPALSRNVRLLESHLNVSLFERRSSGVKLTVPGQMLARRVRLMQLEFDHAQSEIESFQGGRTGQLRIGAIPAWETIYIPEAISAGREDLAGVNFTIVGGLVDELLTMLREGKLDLVCTILEAETYPDLVTEPLLNMERVVVCSANHPLAGRVKVSAQDLLDYSWSQMKGDSITFSRLGGYFSAYDLAPPKVDVECDSNSALLSILRSTDLLGTVPKPIAGHPIFDGLVILPIQGSLWHYKTGVAYRRETTPPAFLLSFISYIRSFIANSTST